MTLRWLPPDFTLHKALSHAGVGYARRQAVFLALITSCCVMPLCRSTAGHGKPSPLACCRPANSIVDFGWCRKQAGRYALKLTFWTTGTTGGALTVGDTNLYQLVYGARTA